MARKAYLDTHVVVWLYSNLTKLISNKALKVIETCNLSFCPIVLLELTYLKEIKRISKDADSIIRFLQKNIDLQQDSTGLSQIIKRANTHNWTRDPFDRIITSCAEINSGILLTKDEIIRKNSKVAIW